MSITETTAKKIKQLREAQNISLRALAKKTNTSHSSIQRHEAGRQTPGLKWLEKIAKALGYKVKILFEKL